MSPEMGIKVLSMEYEDKGRPTLLVSLPEDLDNISLS